MRLGGNFALVFMGRGCWAALGLPLTSLAKDVTGPPRGVSCRKWLCSNQMYKVGAKMQIRSANVSNSSALPKSAMWWSDVTDGRRLGDINGFFSVINNAHLEMRHSKSVNFQMFPLRLQKEVTRVLPSLFNHLEAPGWWRWWIVELCLVLLGSYYPRTSPHELLYTTHLFLCSFPEPTFPSFTFSPFPPSMHTSWGS